MVLKLNCVCSTMDDDENCAAGCMVSCIVASWGVLKLHIYVKVDNDIIKGVIIFNNNKKLW